MNLTWKASESASALHAVHALARGFALVPPGLTEALEPLVSEPPSAARSDLPGLTAELLQYAAAGCEQSDKRADQSLAAWVGNVERAYFEWHRGQTDRGLVDEITTRTMPLRDHWDARGPGMMRQIERLTETWLVAERADVVMVLPAVGGDGMAHLPSNAVTIEALLANADPRLPEVVRLAWLLVQLRFDLPAMAEQLSPHNTARIAQLAMLPPTLAAAEAVELSECTRESLAHALVVWRIASTPQEASDLSEVLAKWWETYLASAITWPAAVAALGGTSTRP